MERIQNRSAKKIQGIIKQLRDGIIWFCKGWSSVPYAEKEKEGIKTPPLSM